MARYRADEDRPYFCTITVLEWLPVLIEARFIDPIIDSLRFCRTRRAMELFGFVVMPHHLHLIAQAGDQLHAVMRDFKRFTSRTIHEQLKADGRLTILNWLSQATPAARRGQGDLGLWQPGFHPQEIYTAEVFEQKLNYLHDNPVRKGLVRLASDWWYSSAGFYDGRESVCMDVDPLEL